MAQRPASAGVPLGWCENDVQVQVRLQPNSPHTTHHTPLTTHNTPHTAHHRINLPCPRGRVVCELHYAEQRGSMGGVC
eukprot:851577-Pyramimonas_sp.AAC.1